jgi:hypothetical protein
MFTRGRAATSESHEHPRRLLDGDSTRPVFAPVLCLVFCCIGLSLLIARVPSTADQRDVCVFVGAPAGKARPRTDK